MLCRGDLATEKCESHQTPTLYEALVQNDHTVSKMSRIVELARIALINFIVFFGLAGVSLVGLEFVLRTTNWLDQSNSPTPTYIPPKFKFADYEINRSGLVDKWGFRSEDGADQLDKLRNSDRNKCRIVILGDSFIWGDGALVGQRWPDQYQRMTRCDVFAFGRNGWTTFEELAFYEAHLSHLEFDWLVIAFAENDPHPRLSLARSFVNSHSIFEKYTLPTENYIRLSLGLTGVNSDYPCSAETGFCWFATTASRPLNNLRAVIRNIRALDYLDQIIGSMVKHFHGLTVQDKNGDVIIMEWGYVNWRNRAYRKDVLSMWERAVADFKHVSKHSFLFLLTVDDPQQRANIAKITGLLKRAGILYFDCASFNEALWVSGLLPRRFWANPANSHPGVEQAQGFAQCLYSNLGI